MPDTSKTRKQVADANDKLTEAKEKEKKTGKQVPLQLRTNLAKAIQAYDAK